jgi:hypothetical protein
MTPDYPSFKMEVSLESYDSIRFSHILSVGDSYFNLKGEDFFTLTDSLQVGDNYFKDVYKIKNRNHESGESIYPDSVYYNYSDGFLKIVMSNNEFYEIQ